MVSDLHALIIDDNAINGKILQQLLALEGVRSTHLLDPREVQSTLAHLLRVHLIFLDLEMPHVDGYTVLDYLRTQPELRDVPVIAYTVHLSEITRAYDLGFHSFIGKPINADLFPEQLQRILNGERVWMSG